MDPDFTSPWNTVLKGHKWSAHQIFPLFLHFILTKNFHMWFWSGGCWCLRRFFPTPFSATRVARRGKRTTSTCLDGTPTSSLRYATGNLSPDIDGDTIHFSTALVSRTPWIWVTESHLKMDYIKLFIRKFYGNTVKEFVQGPGETIYMPVPPKLYIFLLLNIQTCISGTPSPRCDEYWWKPFSDRKPFPARQSWGLGAWVSKKSFYWDADQRKEMLHSDLIKPLN